eukprot:5307321-Pleurochrysis_carterae.AAC.1
MSVEAASVLRQLFDVSGGRQWLRQDGWLKGDPCAAPGWASSSHYDCFSGDLTSTRQPLCCELTPGSNRPKVRPDARVANTSDALRICCFLLPSCFLDSARCENSDHDRMPRGQPAVEAAIMTFLMPNRHGGSKR